MLDVVLLIIFLIHLLIFGKRLWLRGQTFLLAPVITFFLLCCAYSLKLLIPHVAIGNVALYACFRYAAWFTAVISISILLRRIYLHQKSKS